MALVENGELSLHNFTTDKAGKPLPRPDQCEVTGRVRTAHGAKP